MIGKLYGIGVGPGDPELLTLKAIRLIAECDIIAIPGKDKTLCTSYNIARGAYPQIDDKESLILDYPMTKDRKILEASHERNAEQVIRKLDEGKNIVFLTLGDPSIYSTFMYLDKRIRSAEYEVDVISGVPSFCAIASKLSVSLGEEEEEIHIIPASYGVSEVFKLSGTKILMKAGNKLKEIKDIAKVHDCYIAMVENCDMEDEKIIVGVENIPDFSGYFTTLIIKGK